MVALLLIVTTLFVRHGIHRAYLNSELIQAISDGSYPDARALLKEGATGSAYKGQDAGLRQFGIEIWWRFTHPSQARQEPDKLDALALLYNTVLDGRPRFPSIYKAKPECEDLALALLDAGSSPDSRPFSAVSFPMYTLLDCALLCHHHRMVSRLLELSHKHINNPWIALGSADLTDLPILVACGTNVNATSPDGETALMIASSPQTEWLISHGAKVNTTNKFGATPLLYACALHETPTALVLINNGAAVNVRDRAGKTPMLYACNFGTLKLVEAIYKRGGAVNVHDGNGLTCLRLSANNPNRDVRPWLLAHGAN